jgi:hypothetical protein
VLSNDDSLRVVETTGEKKRAGRYSSLLVASTVTNQSKYMAPWSFRLSTLQVAGTA